MVGLDDDTTKMVIRAARRALKIDFKIYERPYMSSTSNSVLEKLLNESGNMKSTDLPKSYLLSSGDYASKYDVVGALRAPSDNTGKTTFVASLEPRVSTLRAFSLLNDEFSEVDVIYLLQGEIDKNALRVKNMNVIQYSVDYVKGNGEIRKGVKTVWTIDDLLNAAGLEAYVVETLHDLGINNIDLSSIEEPKDRKKRDIVGQIFEALGKKYNTKIIYEMQNMPGTWLW